MSDVFVPVNLPYRQRTGRTAEIYIWNPAPARTRFRISNFRAATASPQKEPEPDR